jgi:ABC-2 type transport system ATP-binding protein
MTAIIETEQLTRSFGRTEAVSELTMAVPQGSIFAFVGPNGAGKTTTLKLLMNLLHPTHGKAMVCGVDTQRLGAKDFQQIGYVSENQELPEWMTVRELPDYCRPFFPTWDNELEKKLLHSLCLPSSQKIKHSSRGTRMKAALLSALAFRPRLLALDEPFSGLDLLAREEFLEGLLELSRQDNWTIFISSHDIDKIERLANAELMIITQKDLGYFSRPIQSDSFILGETDRAN